MVQGDKWELFIPSDLGCEHSIGSPTHRPTRYQLPTNLYSPLPPCLRAQVPCVHTYPNWACLPRPCPNTLPPLHAHRQRRTDTTVTCTAADTWEGPNVLGWRHRIALADGDRGAGGDIGPGDALIFTIEIIEINGKTKPVSDEL